MPAPPDPLASYAPIRAVGVPHAPFDGVLARAAGGATVLLVDRDELTEWSGWSAPAAEHVLAPLDVARRGDGHDVVFPVVTERLDRFVARRAATAPLTDGEVVTVAVSVLRGVASVIEEMPDLGQWWITDDGRPLLVLGIGDADPRRASADVLGAAAEQAAPALGALVADLAVTVGSVRRVDALLGDEDRVFAAAEPEPLATTVLMPARTVAVRGDVADDEVDDRDPRPWWLSLASRFDGDLTDVLERLRARRRATSPKRRGGRRLPLLAGVAAAGLVLIGGMLWPEADDAGAEQVVAASASPTASASAPAAAPVDPEPSASAGAGGAPESVLAGLLDARRACADDACRAVVLEDPARPPRAGAVGSAAPIGDGF